MTEAQRTAISDLCARFSAEADWTKWLPAFDLPDGWVAGWVGTPGAGGIYAGVSPEGEIHT